MSYQKHNFTPGAVLFASELNDMDNQIEILSNQEGDLSDNFKTALLNCFENVVWINENGQSYYQALYDSLYPDNVWFITNVLTGCVTSNNTTSVLKNNSYVATITANQGYTLSGATVNITMGGNDVTNLYYSSGSINIPNVTGDLVITVNAVSSVSSISAVFSTGTDTPIDISSLSIKEGYINPTTHVWTADSTSTTICMPVSVGKKYTLSWTETNVNVVGNRFRWGFSNTDTISGQVLSNWGVTTPQITQSVDTMVADKPYLVIQISASYASSILSNNYLSVIECAGVVYTNDTLDTLRQYLTVTATYSDSTTAVVTDYTLSGTLTEGTSNITVSYGGKTDTFNVLVTAYWTFEWDYSMGKLEEQTNWTDDNGGTASSSLVSTGERFVSGSTMNDWHQVVPVSGTPLRTMPNGYGIVEIKFVGHINTSATVANLRFSCSKDDSCRLQTCIIKNSFRILDKEFSSLNNCTVLTSYSNDIEYTERIVLKGLVADFYLNGELIRENISTGVTVAGVSNYIMGQGLGSGNYIDLKSFKLRIGKV